MLPEVGLYGRKRHVGRKFFKPLSRLFISLLAFISLASHAQQVPTIVWPAPSAISYPTPLSSVQLDAVAYAGPAVSVSLAAFYNITGITTDGFAYAGGFDGSSWAWSAELLGSSVSWQGISLPIGPADAPDAVYGGVIPLPSGNFGSLLVLGDLVNNQQPPTAQFLISYTDGTSTTIQQNMSDWVNPRNYSGESLGKCVTTRHNFDGTTDRNSTCAYAYRLPIDPTRTAVSITLPSNRDVVILSLVALPPIVAGTFTYTPAAGVLLTPGQQTLLSQFQPASPTFHIASATTDLVVNPASPRIIPAIAWPSPAPILPGTAISGVQLDASASAPVAPVTVPLAPYARVNAIYDDGSMYDETGFDGTFKAFSAAQLGASLHYSGFSFSYGQPDVPDAVTSSTIPLPPGNFATLYLLGAAGETQQLAQMFTVTYLDGTSTSAKLNLSPWTAPQQFAGETTVASTTFADLSTGLQAAGTFNLYGYQIGIDPTRTVNTLILPDNVNVIFVAAGLGFQTSFPVAGSFVYMPPAGTIPSTSISLNASFMPADSVDVAPVDAVRYLVIGNRGFTLQTVGGSVMTAKTGSSPSLTVQISPTQDHYASPISFSLVGVIPPLATVSFSPSTVGTDGGTTIVTLTIATRKLSGSITPLLPNHFAPILLCGLFFIPFVFNRKRMRQVICMSIVCLGLGMIGCGSGYADHVYPLIIQATDGVTTHNVAVELHIQASPQ